MLRHFSGGLLESTKLFGNVVLLLFIHPLPIIYQVITVQASNTVLAFLSLVLKYFNVVKGCKSILLEPTSIAE